MLSINFIAISIATNKCLAVLISTVKAVKGICINWAAVDCPELVEVSLDVGPFGSNSSSSAEARSAHARPHGIEIVHFLLSFKKEQMDGPLCVSLIRSNANDSVNAHMFLLTQHHGKLQAELGYVSYVMITQKMVESSLAYAAAMQNKSIASQTSFKV